MFVPLWLNLVTPPSTYEEYWHQILCRVWSYQLLACDVEGLVKAARFWMAYPSQHNGASKFIGMLLRHAYVEEVMGMHRTPYLNTWALTKCDGSGKTRVPWYMDCSEWTHTPYNLALLYLLDVKQEVVPHVSMHKWGIQGQKW